MANPVVINDAVINKQLVAERFAKAVGSYDEEAVAQRQIAVRMTESLRQSVWLKASPRILEIGCGTGIYSRLLLESFNPEFFQLNDICPAVEASIAGLLSQNNIRFLAADAEHHDFGTGWDLITSCSTVQWFQALPPFFKRCHASLHREGVLAFTTFGSHNLKEIKELTGHSLAYPGLQEITDSLSGSFNVILNEEAYIEQWLDSPQAVLYHIKRTGVSGIRRKAYTRGELQTFCREYEKRYSKDGKVRLTYHPIYIIAQKR